MQAPVAGPLPLPLPLVAPAATAASTAPTTPYTGRFAPSPTGWLHAGSLVAALASWLDARAHGGQWRVRIEDTDTARCVAGADHAILGQLAACGLHPDGPVLWQSLRHSAYQAALDALAAKGWAYACSCSRKTIQAAQHHAPQRHSAAVYPGTCRPAARSVHTSSTSGAFGQPKINATAIATPHAWRLDVAAVQSATGLCATTHWTDRVLGPQHQDVGREVGDFVLRRADGLWAYQLAVVVDDAAQGITHVVRGQDLADNTARQIVLQRALGVATPQHLHTPLVLAPDGQKLSKQNAATPLHLPNPIAAQAALNAAAQALALPPHPGPQAQALAFWTVHWRTRLQAGAALPSAA